MLTLVSVFIVCSGDCSTSYSYPTVVCPSLSLTNGTISYSDPTLGVGSVATHSCDTGYILNGKRNRTCQSYGNWSGSAPTCKGEYICNHQALIFLYTPPTVSCGSPPSISNGSPGTPTSTMIGGTVTYSCDTGYTMSDSANNLVTCLSTGNWSAPPSCQSELLTGLLDTAPQVFSPLQSLLQSTSLSPPPTTCLVSQRFPCPPWKRGVAVLLSVIQTHPPAVDSWTLEWRVVWGSGTIRMAQSSVLTQQEDCM